LIEIIVYKILPVINEELAYKKIIMTELKNLKSTLFKVKCKLEGKGHRIKI
jgi:hypothetical protein